MVNTNLYTKEQLKEMVFTDAELTQLEKARKMPVTFDDDCPAVTPEQALKFKRVNPSRRLADA